MKQMVFILFLLVCSKMVSNAQISNKDSLIYYSYLLHGKNNQQLLNTGTGTIIRVNKRFFLVTNDHVLTGKDHSTGKKFPELADTSNAVSIAFPLKTPGSFKTISYRLYKKNRRPLFRSYPALDISVLPIKIPRLYRRPMLDMADIDTSGNYKNGTPLSCYGFPGGETSNGWQPTEFETKAVSVPYQDMNNRKAYVYFDRTPLKGMSGSPIYFKDSSGHYRLLSLQSNQVRSEYGQHYVKGRSIYALYAIKLIAQLKKEKVKPVSGKTDPGNASF